MGKLKGTVFEDAESKDALSGKPIFQRRLTFNPLLVFGPFLQIMGRSLF